MRYGLFDKQIFAVDDDNIITQITNIEGTVEYKRITSARKKYICGKELPDTYEDTLYNSIDILKKAKKLYDFTKDLEICGLYTDYYSDGLIKEKYFHNKGIKEGAYYKYYCNENNTIEIECNYVNNILNGEYIKYYQNGNPEIKCNYMDNKIEGEYFYYSNNNDKNEYRKFLYINNKKEGECYFETSKSICFGKCVDNALIELVERDRITNIILSQRYICKENSDLIVIEIYYDSGKLKQKYTITKDEKANGEYIKYYENGNICSINYYKDNREILTKKIEYYENGNIKSHTLFDDVDNNIYRMIKYCENGKIFENITYIDNHMLKYEKYDISGILIDYKFHPIINGNKEYNKINYNVNIKNINKEDIKKFALKLLESLE
jgi:antitoxin component YwqK of YwqJK toxin-antitoxin module